jgi:hypothetical protein
MTTALIEAGVTELTFVASATTAGAVPRPALPAPAQAGDLAILLDFGWLGTVSPAAPAGWEEIAISSSPAPASICTSYKVLEASDLGDTFTGVTADRIRQIIIVLRPDEEIADVIIEDLSTFGAVGNPPSQVVDASDFPEPGAVIGVWADTNPDQTNLSSSPAFTSKLTTTGSGVSVGGTLELGYKIYNSPPADHTNSASGTGGRMMQSFFIRCE